jgi:large subunit ribosomal protein L30
MSAATAAAAKAEAPAKKPAKKPAAKAAKKAAKSDAKTLVIRQVKSSISTPQGHREVLKSLGLRRIRHSVERADSAAVRGMINKISYLVEVEEAQ